MKYRLYIDEVGNPDLNASQDPNHRYLSLTGVILELGYVDATVFPALEGLKRKYFGSHPDEPVILHRKELLNKKHPFEPARSGHRGGVQCRHPATVRESGLHGSDRRHRQTRTPAAILGVAL